MAAIDLPYCDISVQESCSKLNTRLMSRGVFSTPPHPAASQSYRQLVHRALLPSCLKTQRVRPAVWCLLQVTIRALAFSGTLAGEGNPATPQDSVWLFWCGYFGIWCSSEAQPHINWLPCVDLKITSAQMNWRTGCNLICTLWFYWYPKQNWWQYIACCALAFAH